MRVSSILMPAILVLRTVTARAIRWNSGKSTWTFRDCASKPGEAIGTQPRYGMHGDHHSAANFAFKFIGGCQDTIEAYLKYFYFASRDSVKETINYQDAL